MPELVIAGMIGWLAGLSLALWEHRKKQSRLQEAVEQLEWHRVRIRTWAELIYDLELVVCDVQVDGISDVLRKLAYEQQEALEKGDE